MTFKTDMYSVPDLVAEFTAMLAATPDFELYDDQVTNGYALRHSTDLFITIRRIPSVIVSSATTSGSRTDRGGLGITTSSGFDDVAHVPAGTIYDGLIPLYGNNGPIPASYTDVDRLYPVDYWVDKYGIVGAIKNPFTDLQSTGCFFAFEFMPNTWKEYNDGFTPVFFHTVLNYNYWRNTGAQPGQNLNYYYEGYHCFHHKTFSPAIVKSSESEPAFRSVGNSKVYFQFPYYQNDLVNYRDPVAQSRRWFDVQTTGALAVNDIIAWLDVDGVTVRKYLIVDVPSGSSGNNPYFAIPYENAVPYG